jgi:ABC-type dipeptide/oligopeptide/nickel transport system permease subunit
VTASTYDLEGGRGIGVKLGGYWRIVRGDKLLMISGVVVAMYVLLAVVGDYVAPRNPFALDPTAVLQPPGGKYWLGTDTEGRDILSRIIYGTRYSIISAFAVIGLAVGGGFLYGTIAAYAGGRFDRISMRAFDVMLSFPPIVTALVFIAVVGPGIWPVVIGVAVGYFPSVTRIVRSEAVVESGKNYMLAAQALGFTNLRIVGRHLMPNCTGQVVVQATTLLPYAVIDVAGLSFLGFGVQAPQPDWGNMLAEGKTDLFLSPWMVVFPGLAVIGLVLAWNTLGNRLRRRLRPGGRVLV